ERGDADRLAFEVLQRLNGRGVLRRSRDREQRYLAGAHEAADVGAFGVGLHCDVERGRAIVDRAADQRLDRSVATAEVDDLGVEAVLLEMTEGARDLVGRRAEELAAERERHFLKRLARRRSGGAEHACEGSGALEDRAARHVGRGKGRAGYPRFRYES